MNSPAILIIDDDPSHLRIYGWIMRAAGYCAVPALVTRDTVDLPDTPVDLVLLDYHLNSHMTAVEIAVEARQRFGGAPILVLSDALMLPDEMRPLVDGFVRKGDPAHLVEAVGQTLASRQTVQVE
jgi:DNA-binding response OmpR family regulator